MPKISIFTKSLFSKKYPKILVEVVPEKPLREVSADDEPSKDLDEKLETNGISKTAEPTVEKLPEKTPVEIADPEETPKAIKKKKNKLCRCC